MTFVERFSYLCYMSRLPYHTLHQTSIYTLTHTNTHTHTHTHTHNNNNIYILETTLRDKTRGQTTNGTAPNTEPHATQHAPQHLKPLAHGEGGDKTLDTYLAHIFDVLWCRQRSPGVNLLLTICIHSILFFHLKRRPECTGGVLQR